MTKVERRKLIVRRVAAGKIRETWRRRKRDEVRRTMFDDPDEDPAGNGELDALPDYLVG